MAAFAASRRTAEVRPPLLQRARDRLSWLAPVGVLVGYGVWCWAAGRIAGLLGTAGSFWHDLIATALITAPLFACLWWSTRQENGAAWEALAFWAGLALFATFMLSL